MTATPLTADMIARAIIAAAAIYETDPERACLAKSGMMRRPLTAASYGIGRAAGVHERQVSRILGLGLTAVAQARNMGSGRFWKAALAAEEAARGHMPAAPDEPLRIPVEFDEPMPPEPEPAPRPTFIPPRAGAISAPIRPAPFVAQKPAQEPTTTLRGRILAALRDAPCTAPNLAILVDAKELPISDTLRSLEREGVVVAGPIPTQGQRHRAWALAAEVAA